MPKRDQIGPKAYMADYLNHTGGFKTTSASDAVGGSKNLQDAAPGKMLSQFITSPLNA